MAEYDVCCNFRMHLHFLFLHFFTIIYITAATAVTGTTEERNTCILMCCYGYTSPMASQCISVI